MQVEVYDALEPLSARESKRLVELETVIKHDLKAFLRVGAALSEIRDSGLYRGNHLTFKEYLADEWNLGKSTGHQFINAHIVIENLSAIADKQPLLFVDESDPSHNGPRKTILPQNEAQIRPMVQYKDDTETLALIWAKAIDSAPNGKITAKQVSEVVTKVTGKTKKDKINETRQHVQGSIFIDQKFTTTFDAFLEQVEISADEGWKKTDRGSVLKHLHAVARVVASGQREINEDVFCSYGANPIKLEKAGFKIFRQDTSLLNIKERAGGGWRKHSGPYESKAAMQREFTLLMDTDLYIEG